MDSIASRAGLSVGALYRYFRSKEDLLVSLLLEPLEAALREIDRVAATPGSASSKMDSVITILVAQWSRYPGISRAAALLVSRKLPEEVSPELAAAVLAVARDVVHRCASILAAAAESGEYRKHDSHRLAGVFCTTLYGILQLHEAGERLGAGGPSIEDRVRESWQVLESGLLS